MFVEALGHWTGGFLTPDTAIIRLFMGLTGLVVGSFLAAVSVRLPRGEDIVFGRSRCRDCERTLASQHLIPVVSWIALRGKCGWCSARISPRYVLIELTAAAIGVWSALAGSTSLLIVVTALLGWQLLLIAIVDAEHFWLPDVLTWPLIASGLVVAGWQSRGIPWSGLAGAILGLAGLMLLAWVYRIIRGREGLGGGDPFVFAGAGAWVGYPGLPWVMLGACLAGFVLVASRLIVLRQVHATDRLPFGTCIALGTWLIWLGGLHRQ